MYVSQYVSLVRRWRHAWLGLVIGLLLSGSLLVACSGLGIGSSFTPTAAPTPSQLPLAKLRWCNKPFILFRDEHAPATGTPGGTPAATATATASATSTATGNGTPTTTPTTGAAPTPTSAASPTPTTLTDWSQIEPGLGFTVYLPKTLPRKACLVSASGTINDPIFGGSFIIGYLLPDNSSISLSEAPARTNTEFQCTSTKASVGQVASNPAIATPVASPTKTSALLCTGVKGSTNIVFSGQGSQTSLQKFFDALQANVKWVPGS